MMLSANLAYKQTLQSEGARIAYPSEPLECKRMIRVLDTFNEIGSSDFAEKLKMGSVSHILVKLIEEPASPIGVWTVVASIAGENYYIKTQRKVIKIWKKLDTLIKYLIAFDYIGHISIDTDDDVSVSLAMSKLNVISDSFASFKIENAKPLSQAGLAEKLANDLIQEKVIYNIEYPANMGMIWLLAVQAELEIFVLQGQRQQIRTWRSIDAMVRYLDLIGITNFKVKMTNFRLVNEEM